MSQECLSSRSSFVGRIYYLLLVADLRYREDETTCLLVSVNRLLKVESCSLFDRMFFTNIVFDVLLFPVFLGIYFFVVFIRNYELYIRDLNHQRHDG